MKCNNKNVKKLDYRIEKTGKRVHETNEKTFCFTCGCFQGVIGPDRPIIIKL